MRVAALWLVAVALRWPGLRERPLWHDEGLTWAVASAPTWSEASARFLATEMHPPLYDLLATVALPLGPASAIRWPAFAASLATVAVLQRVASRAGGDAMGERAAWFCAVLPPLVAYGREGRPWALAVLAVALVLDARDRGSAARVLASLFALASGWGAGMVAAAVAVRDRAWSSIVALAVGGALAAPLVAHQMAGLRDFAARRPPSWPEDWLAMAGWWLTGWDAVPWALGAALWVGLATAPGPQVRALASATGLFVVLSVADLWPLGPHRGALLLMPFVALALAERLPGWNAVAMVVLLGGISVARFPGVPVTDISALCHDLAGVVVVDPSASPAWRANGCPSGVTFATRSVEPPMEEGVDWVVVAGRRAMFPWGPGKEAEGVRAVPASAGSGRESLE